MQEPQKPQNSVHEFLRLLTTQEANFAPLVAWLMDYSLEVASLANVQEMEIILHQGIIKTLEEKFIKHTNYDHSQLSKAISAFYRSTTDYANRNTNLSFLSKAVTAVSDWKTGGAQKRQENLTKAAKEIEQLVEQFSSSQQNTPVMS